MQCVPRLEPCNEKEPASATGTIVNDFFVGILAPRFQLSEQVIRLPPERKLGKQGDLHFLGSEWKVVFGGATYLSKPSLGMSRCLKKLSDEFARK